MTVPINDSSNTKQSWSLNKIEKILHQLIFEHPVLLVESLEGGVWLSAVHLQDFQAVLMSPTFSFSIWNLTFLVFVLFLLVVTCITKERLQLDVSMWSDTKEGKNVLKKECLKEAMFTSHLAASLLALYAAVSWNREPDEWKNLS